MIRFNHFIRNYEFLKYSKLFISMICFFASVCHTASVNMTRESKFECQEIFTEAIKKIRKRKEKTVLQAPLVYLKKCSLKNFVYSKKIFH